MDSLAGLFAALAAAAGWGVTHWFDAFAAHPWLTLGGTALAGWQVSVRRNPWTDCRRCKGAGKFFGWLAGRSFHDCPRCGGTQKRLRVTASDPATRAARRR